MYDTTRSFIESLGGYRAVAKRLRLGETTVHGHMLAGTLPAKWYAACIAMAGERGIEPPQRQLFSFMPLPALTTDSTPTPERTG